MPAACVAADGTVSAKPVTSRRSLGLLMNSCERTRKRPVPVNAMSFRSKYHRSTSPLSRRVMVPVAPWGSVYDVAADAGAAPLVAVVPVVGAGDGADDGEFAEVGAET